MFCVHFHKCIFSKLSSYHFLGHDQDLEDEVRSTTRELEVMKHSKTVIETKVAGLEADLTSSRAEVTSFKSAITQMTANISAVQCELDATKVYKLCIHCNVCMQSDWIFF